MNLLAKLFNIERVVKSKPSNDIEARIMGRLVVQEFLKEFGPGIRGQGVSRLKTFIYNNPGIIITNLELNQIGVGGRSELRRRELVYKGYITTTFLYDEGLKPGEYRIIGYNKDNIKDALHTCPADVRAAVLNRAGGICQNCGYIINTIHEYTGQKEILEIHRVIPGSLYALEGCLAFCKPCNQGLSDMIIAKKSRCEILRDLLEECDCNIGETL